MWCSSPTHGPRTPRWALGILIYEMLVGAAPFSDPDDPIIVYQKILKGSLPDR